MPRVRPETMKLRSPRLGRRASGPGATPSPALACVATATLALATLPPAPAHAAPARWEPVADLGMDVGALAVHTDGTLWAGLGPAAPDSAGAWRSSDDGATWTHALATGGPGIASFAFDPDHETHAWVGWDAPRASVSTDSGASWRDVTGFGFGTSVVDIAIPAGNDPVLGPHRVYFATQNGVYSSADGGLTLEHLTDYMAVSQVEVCPGDPLLVWAGKTSGRGAMYSTDGGDTWTDVEDFDGRDRIGDLSMNAADCGELLVRATAPAQNDHVALTRDGGLTWSPLEGATGHGALIQVSTDGTFYIMGAGDEGMYVSSTADAFDAFADGLPGAPTVLAGDPRSGLRVHAGVGTAILAITADLLPGAPTGATAACSDSFEVTVEWERVTSNHDGSPYDDPGGYVVYADVPPFGDVDEEVAVIADPDATSFVHTDFGGMVVLSYFVSAMDAAGNRGPISNPSGFVAPADCETGIGGDVPAPGVALATLFANAPNPFNPRTVLSYRVGEEAAGARLTLDVHDIAGRRLRRLVDAPAVPGVHRVPWDGSTRAGGVAPTGVYVARLEVGDFTESRRMLLVQ